MTLKNSVATLSEYAEWVEGAACSFTKNGEVDQPWFRGAGSKTHTLVPGLYRSEAGRQPLTDDELRSEFMRRGLPLVIRHPPKNDWEWYFLMQHYRAPTRLLDWTEGALVALYFALASYSSMPEAARTAPVVWALNPTRLNVHAGIGELVPGSDWDEIRAYLPPCYTGEQLPKLPAAMDPSLIDARMLVQQSHFTIHGSDQRGFEQIGPFMDNGTLLRVTIDLDIWELGNWQQQLQYLGMKETTIFPDLEGLARELRLEYDVA